MSAAIDRANPRPLGLEEVLAMNAFIAGLEAENQRLRAMLETTGVTRRFARLSKSQLVICRRLLAASPELVTFDDLQSAVFGGGPLTSARDAIVRQQVHRTRGKLQAFGIIINSVYGRGYRMPAEAAHIFRQLIGVA